ncbi:MAG TPA: hypothetical protein VFX21_09420, partial [Acidimicrobiia bacterium]|nr:hypothetical protein [Acidimicrobiia bacterium]
EASTMMQSASLVTDTRDGKSAVFDSWDIDATGNSFAGDLVDRWPGFVYNQITTSQLFVPCRPELGGMALADQLATGTHVEGALDGDRLTLTLVGQSFDTEVRFRATLEAERVEG